MVGGEQDGAVSSRNLAGRFLHGEAVGSEHEQRIVYIESPEGEVLVESVAIYRLLGDIEDEILFRGGPERTYDDRVWRHRLSGNQVEMRELKVALAEVDVVGRITHTDGSSVLKRIVIRLCVVVELDAILSAPDGIDEVAA